jgi:hypothetical protein
LPRERRRPRLLTALPRSGLRLAAVLAGLIAIVAGVVGPSLPSSAATGTFSLDRLRLGGAAGPEDYLYTGGNVIYPDGGVDPGTYYKFVVKDSAGTVRNPSFPLHTRRLVHLD